YPDRAIGTISRKDLVGPKGIPIIGNLISILRRNTYIQYQQELANKYADFDEYGKSDDFYEIGYDVFGDGIFAVDGMSFDVDFGCLTHPEEKSQFVTDFDFAQDTIFERYGRPFWKFIEKYSEKGRKMRKACKYIDDYVYNMINNHKSELEIEKKSVKN
ncbi:9391_t:CDS:2, partial [Dentiscutata heterogama]